MEITGRHVLFGFVAAFGVIISVNLVMARFAIKTFPGLETESSYIANQTFDEERDAQEALGWDVTARVVDGFLVVDIRDAAGQPVQAQSLTGIFGRPTNVRDDQTPEFQWLGTAYTAPITAHVDGNWDFRMEAVAEDGTMFRRRIEVTFAE